MISRLSGLASYSAGTGLTGRRLANSPSPLRRPEQPLLGPRLVRVGGVPFRAPDGGQQHRVGVPAGRQRLVGQRDPVRRRSRRRRTGAPRTRAAGTTASRTWTAGARISGPIPSPGRRTIFCCHGRGTLPDRQTAGRACSGGHTRASTGHRCGPTPGPRTARAAPRGRFQVAHEAHRGDEVARIAQLDGSILQPALDAERRELGRRIELADRLAQAGGREIHRRATRQDRLDRWLVEGPQLGPRGSGSRALPQTLTRSGVGEDVEEAGAGAAGRRPRSSAARPRRDRCRRSRRRSRRGRPSSALPSPTKWTEPTT